jgi:5-methylcytosine-specific restriction endonuclease McrA
MNWMERLPFAKPLRIIAPDLLRSYCRSHPACEVDGCRRRPAPEPHHVIPRSRGRSDLHENLLRLCPSHHRAWHVLGSHEWWRRYGDRLLDEARAKVLRALRLLEIL